MDQHNKYTSLPQSFTGRLQAVDKALCGPFSWRVISDIIVLDGSIAFCHNKGIVFSERADKKVLD